MNQTPQEPNLTPAQMETLYEELRRIAKNSLRISDQQVTLQPTMVVHEAYLRLAKHSISDWHSRTHFVAVAAKAMRQVLINHHRDRNALKRGGGRDRVTLSGCDPLDADTEFDFLTLHEALEDLAKLDSRQSQIVELRFFGDLTMQAIADHLQLSLTTIENEWRHAKAWLNQRLDPH